MQFLVHHFFWHQRLRIVRKTHHTCVAQIKKRGSDPPTRLVPRIVPRLARSRRPQLWLSYRSTVSAHPSASDQRVITPTPHDHRGQVDVAPHLTSRAPDGQPMMGLDQLPGCVDGDWLVGHTTTVCVHSGNGQIGHTRPAADYVADEPCSQTRSTSPVGGTRWQDASRPHLDAGTQQMIRRNRFGNFRRGTALVNSRPPSGVITGV
jgi:hypothetical protein